MDRRRCYLRRAGILMIALLPGCGGGGDGGGGGGGGGPVTPTPGTGAVAGSVTAGGTGVAAAGVALGGPSSQTAQTSAQGQYSFQNLPVGSYTATLTLPAGFGFGTETPTKPAVVSSGVTTRVDWTVVAAPTGPVTNVQVAGVTFAPAEVIIAVGVTVRWTAGEGGHTVTPDNPNQAGVWTDPGSLNAGQTFQHTFTRAGTYPYHCIPHRSAGMTGVIRVT
jgi:plastocyanin